MTYFYAAMAALTAVHIWRVNRPTEIAHWIALSTMAAVWPLVFATVVFGLGARTRDSDATRSAETACPAPVPQDLQARAESIAQDQSPNRRSGK